MKKFIELTGFDSRGNVIDFLVSVDKITYMRESTNADIEGLATIIFFSEDHSVGVREIIAEINDLIQDDEQLQER